MSKTIIEQQESELTDKLFVHVEAVNNTSKEALYFDEHVSIDDAHEQIVSLLGEDYKLTKIVTNFDITEFIDDKKDDFITIKNIFDTVFDILDMTFGDYAKLASWVIEDGMRLEHNPLLYINLIDDHFLLALNHDDADQKLGEWFIDNHTTINKEEYANFILSSLNFENLAQHLQLSGWLRAINCHFNTDRIYYFKE